MADKPNPRNSAAYRAWRTKVLTTCEPTCIRCGYPVDMTLKGNHPDGPSADHEPPLALTGEIAPSLDGAGIAHLHCNRSHGGRLGSQRATANRAKNKSNEPKNRSLNTHTSTPAAPSRLSPRGGTERPEKPPTGPDIGPDGLVHARLETKAPATVGGSYGGQAAEWLRGVYGMQLRPWQVHALNRALEHDESGALIWSTVIITVARQSGKSWLSRALCMWRLHHADLFGETQTVLHVANKRATAMEVMRPAGLWAVEQYGKSAAKWGNETAGITLPSGDRWLIHAANDSAGVGYSVSMVFVDEAWKVKRDVVDDALAPTMAERISPQLYLVSTAGDSTSDLMTSYRQRALDRLDDDDPGSVLLLEWSAPAEADPDEESTWQWASPEWSDKRLAFLRKQWANIEESAWRREYLNQWVTRADHWLRDSVWNGALDIDESLPDAGVWHVGVESDFDGMGHAVAVVGLNMDGRYVCRISTHRTIKDVDARLAELRAAHPALDVSVTPGYAERLTSRFDRLVGQREAPAATRNLLDLFDQGLIRHDGSQILHEHIANSVISKRQGGWVLTAPMGRGGVYGARALMFALAEASKAPKAVPIIRTRRRA